VDECKPLAPGIVYDDGDGDSEEGAQDMMDLSPQEQADRAAWQATEEAQEAGAFTRPHFGSTKALSVG
jgi:hypothetical protein